MSLAAIIQGRQCTPYVKKSRIFTFSICSHICSKQGISNKLCTKQSMKTNSATSTEYQTDLLKRGKRKKSNLRFKYVSNKFPVKPSMVSSIGSMWTRFPYLTSWHWWTEITSPSLTLRFARTTLFILIFGSSHVSSARAMQIVSLRFFPWDYEQQNIKIRQNESWYTFKGGIVAPSYLL